MEHDVPDADVNAYDMALGYTERLEATLKYLADNHKRVIELEAALRKIRDAQLFGLVLDPDYDLYEAQRAFTKKLQDIARRALEGDAS